jgi:Tfp pilus assembly protein PilE
MTSSTPTRRGLTLIEAMLVVLVLGFLAVAGGVSLQSLVRQPTNTNLALAVSNSMVDKMEYLRSLTFNSLLTGTSYSDTVTINGTTYNRSVTVALADADGNGATDVDFKSVTITLAGQTLTTYVASP